MLKSLFAFILTMIFQYCFSQNEDTRVLTKLNQDWLHSYVTRDKAIIASIFADDFILISPKGAKMTKRDIINNLDNQETVSVAIDSIEVKLLTDAVGLITAYTNFVLRIDGKNVDGKNCYQDVYVKRKGKWFAVAAHVSLLSMN